MNTTIDFKMIKKINNKVALWMGAVTFFVLIIALVIFVSLPTIHKNQQIVISLNLLINCILILITILLIGWSQIITSFLYHQVSYKDQNNQQIMQEKFEMSKISHIVIIAVLLLITTLQIVTMVLVSDKFSSLLTTYWWVIVVCCFWNILITYLSFGFKTYLYNNLLKK
ncbi:hypothetical protein [Williamsoniiplasma luminosum]|uniref:Uncharacterized protein n=1 Tax=Williamsoniiplasma luminosum TaxID=214888 RepID=A0A2S0NKC6_9MOLU|nr:hypothetical protein [Williamsoniiplasma luminosum]AVP49461.1 MAG: hypothetical protein C5T88_02685 [Williamsoniiplasma luminosum]